VRKLQVTRRIVQFAMLALFLLIPVTARYHNYLMARQLDKNIERWEGSLQGGAMETLDVTYRALPGGEKMRVDRMERDRKHVLGYSQQLKGGPWSAQLGPVSLTDPLAGAESVAASRSAVNVLWIGLLIPVGLALVLGRVFCSWVCPMNLLLEFTDKLRGVLRFLEIQPSDVRFSYWTKYGLLAVGLLLTLMLSIPVLGYVYPPAMIGRELHALVAGIFDRAELGRTGLWWGGLTWVSLAIVAIALFEVAISRRWWCRYVCPGGALYSLLGRYRLVRVKLLKSSCTDCAACVPACPMGLNPMRDQMGADCDNCGVCISNCPGALTYSLQLPKPPAGKVRAHAPTP